MSIQDTRTAQSGFVPGAGVQQQQARPAFQAQEGQEGGWSFHDHRSVGQTMPAINGNAVYTKLRDKLIEMYKQARDAKITLIELDTNTEPNLVYSCLVVAAEKASEMDLGVAYTVLIIEATGVKELAPKVFNFGNGQFPVPLFTSDAYDNALIKMAADRVQKVLPGRSTYMAVDPMVVPRTLDVENDAQVYNLAANAGVAIGTELDVRSKEFRLLNLAAMRKDSTLVLSSQFQRGVVLDAVGLPMRSDVTIAVTSRKNNQQNQQNQQFLVNTGDREIPVTGLSGYVDAAWNPLQSYGGMMPAGYIMPGMPLPTQKFVARLIITNIVSTYGYTLDRVLLALASASNLSAQDAWTPAFRPSVKPVKNVGGNIDITDVGALNIDANMFNDESGFGQPVPTKLDSFKNSDLRDYLTKIFRPGMSISVDCPENGAQSWILSVFVNAANSKSNAYRVMYDACMQITNGNFQKHFAFGDSFFEEIAPGVFADKIHNGYWDDLSGTRRDIRDFDHVAVCNLVGRNNPELIREFSDTYYRTDFPIEVRMDGRANKIKQFAQDQVVFTGRSDRMTFSSKFFAALIAGINETQVSLLNQSPLSAGDLNSNRGIAAFASSAIVVPNVSLMSNGFGQQAGQAGWFSQAQANPRWM